MKEQVLIRLILGVPLIRDKISFIMSGRKTYGELLAKLLFPRDISRNNMQVYYFDFIAKLNYTINADNKLFLSGYSGKDVFELGNEPGKD